MQETTEKVISRIKSKMVFSASEALDLAQEFLGDEYIEASKDRYVSADNARQVRIGDKDISGTHAGGPHINFDVLRPKYKSYHIYFI